MKKHVINIMCCFLIFSSMLFLCKIEAFAAYENTYANTGNQRTDIIGIAKTQLGYSEGTSGYTKYGAEFSNAYGDWCAYFVSWCAKEANIPETILRRQGGASPYASYFNIPYYVGTSYTPQPGDLFFDPYTKSDGSIGFEHVGLVYYISGNQFYTIEGNYNNKVCSIARTISNYYFGVPNYESGSTVTPSYGKDSRYPVPFQAYTLSGQSYEVYSSVGGSKTGGYIASNDICTVNEVYDNGWLKVTYPITGGTRTAYSKTSEFFYGSYANVQQKTAVSNATAYTRSDLSAVRGEMYSGDVCTIVGELNNYYQVICPWSSSSAGNFLVWVPRSAFAHTHSYWTAYEGAHPHRYYTKCDCGDYYYTGENYFDNGGYILEFEGTHPHRQYKMCNICGYDYTEYTGVTRTVDSCTICNPPIAEVPVLNSVTVSGTSVTLSWSKSNNATSYDAYLVQSPWGWEDIKYSKTGITSTSYTFANVAYGKYKAFIIARPQPSNQKQSNWIEADVTLPQIVGEGIEATATEILEGETVTFTISATGATSYLYKIGDGTNVLFSETITEKTFDYTFETAGTYAIWAYAINNVVYCFI